MPDFDKLWDYSNPAATEQKFRALLPEAARVGDISYQLQLQTQIARCLGLQDRFAECHTLLDVVEQSLPADAHAARVRYLLERGRAFRSSSQPNAARPLFVEAWNQATANHLMGYAADAAHMVALAEPDLNAQEEWNLKGLAIAETHEPRWIATILNNLGETYRAGKKFGQALHCFERRAQWFRERQREPDIFTLKDIAKMKRELGNVAEALAIIEPIARQLQSRGESDGYISAEYGQCLAALGRRDEARPILAHAFEELSKDDYMVRHEPEELQQLKALAGY